MALRDRKNQKKKEEGEKVIEINAQMQGTLSFKDPVSLKINGNFNGTLETRGTLTVGSTASVEAHINGENIVIGGRVQGDIIAKKMLVLMPTAVLNGNVSTPKLNIVEGAVFNGKCQMNADSQPEPGEPQTQSKQGESTDSDELLNIDAVARYLELEKQAIIELANSGKIPATKDGKDWTFERSKIDNWAASGRVK